MALSARERRMLDEIETALRADCPRLEAAMLRFSASWRIRLVRRWRASAALALAGLALLVGLITAPILASSAAAGRTARSQSNALRVPARGWAGTGKFPAPWFLR